MDGPVQWQLHLQNPCHQFLSILHILKALQRAASAVAIDSTLDLVLTETSDNCNINGPAVVIDTLPSNDWLQSARADRPIRLRFGFGFALKSHARQAAIPSVMFVCCDLPGTV